MSFCSAGKNGSAKDVEDAIDNSVVIIKETIRILKGFDDKDLYKKIYNLLFETDTDLVKAGLCREDIYKRTEANVLSREFIKEVIQNFINLENLMTDKSNSIYKFPEDQFVLEHYLEDENATVYPVVIKNLERTYKNLMNIFNYYKQTGLLSRRSNRSHIIVVRGVLSADNCEGYFGDRRNPHSNGKAIDFKFDCVSNEMVFNDITEGKITLDKGCEVILLRDSIHLGCYPDRSTLRIEKFKKEEIF